MKKLTLSPTNLYQEASRRYEEIYVAKALLEKRLRRYPEGKIHIAKKKGKVQYYIRASSKDRDGKYLSKKQYEEIKIYLQKKYDETSLKLIELEITGLEKFLKKCDAIDHKIQKIYSEYPQEIKDYIQPLDMSNDDFAMSWQQEPYQGKEVSSDVPVFITNRGEHVRSKSELMIANRLFEMHIPYKYEYPLRMSGEVVLYPDFVILDINKRREVYWEHRGMMDNKEYANHSVKRMKDYNRKGIYLGDNLIMTEETSAFPLDTREIDNVIMHYFINTRQQTDDAESL